MNIFKKMLAILYTLFLIVGTACIIMMSIKMAIYNAPEKSELIIYATMYVLYLFAILSGPIVIPWCGKQFNQEIL